jgi:hypothetical protein
MNMSVSVIENGIHTVVSYEPATKKVVESWVYVDHLSHFDENVIGHGYAFFQKMSSDMLMKEEARLEAEERAAAVAAELAEDKKSPFFQMLENSRFNKPKAVI